MKRYKILNIIFNIAAVCLFVAGIVTFSSESNTSVGIVFICCGFIFLNSANIFLRKQQENSEKPQSPAEETETEEDKREKGFKDYIEKRTVAQIMEDYGEQRDEWQVLHVVQNGNRIDYPQEEEETLDGTDDVLPEKTTVHAEVVDMVCGTGMAPIIGHKTPKAVRYFLLKFKTDDGQELEFEVEEEIYQGFDVGLTGTLTYVGEDLYGFEPDAE